MASLVDLRWGLTLNEGLENSSHAMGFDAFESEGTDPTVFVLCDGANGTPQGGPFAKALSASFLNYFSQPLAPGERAPLRPSVDLSIIGQHLDALGVALDRQFPDSAATLTAARFMQGYLQAINVGDSYVRIFQRRFFHGWQQVASLGRHQNAAGEPTQLIGAPIAVQPYWFETKDPGDWLVALMTDGAGDFLSTEDMLSHVQLLGRTPPSQADLSFCTQTLSHLAMDRGSDDDVSICLIWMRLGA